MKINENNTSATVRPNKPIQTQPGKAQPQPSSTATTSQPSAGLQRLMQSHFARVGVSPSLPLHESKQRRQALARRQDILETHKIENLQAVLNVAMSVSLPDTEPEPLDPDWLFAFCALAENIHSKAMQELWGKIYAVEVSQPGSFSLRTLETLRTLTQKDARLFTKATAVASRRNTDNSPRLLVGYHQRPGLLALLRSTPSTQLSLSSYGLSYPDLLALADMKLIYANEIESGELAPEKRATWRCGSSTFHLTPRKAGIALVYYKFTSVGAELYRLMSRQESEGYLQAFKELLAPVFVVE